MVLLSALATFVFPLTFLCMRKFLNKFVYCKEWTDENGVKRFIGYNCQPKEKDPNHDD
jgi:hypothetical protein